MHTIRDTVSYHEAGHAVVSWALGVELIHVFVGDLDGKVTGIATPIYLFDPPDFLSLSDWNKLEKKALILLAGELAECAYNELRDEDVNDEYLAFYDRRDLAELLKLYGEHEYPPIDMSEQALRTKTNKLIEKHWCQIEALATALMKNGVMSGHEAIKIIESIKL